MLKNWTVDISENQCLKWGCEVPSSVTKNIFLCVLSCLRGKKISLISENQYLKLYGRGEEIS